jgi:hypothetical protein
MSSILSCCESRQCRRCADQMVFSLYIAVGWQNLARTESPAAKRPPQRPEGAGREPTALFDGLWLVGEGPSSDNGIAALPTDVSVCTWLSQAGRFIRAVVTSNVERVMMSQVDMDRYCHPIVRMSPRFIVQKEGARANDFWCSTHRPSRGCILEKAA